jgi:hypothetical protein
MSHYWFDWRYSAMGAPPLVLLVSFAGQTAHFLLHHHYGHRLYMRLLDWSDGSLMAAHLSMRSKARQDELRTGAVVYVLDPHWLAKYIDDRPATKERRRVWDTKRKSKPIPEDDCDNQYNSIWLPGNEKDFKEDPLHDHPFLIDTEQIPRRVATQRSRFMVFGANRDFLRQMANDERSRIRKVVIPGDCIKPARRPLPEHLPREVVRSGGGHQLCAGTLARACALLRGRRS